MKKVISIILSLIMIASVFALPVGAVTVSATECTCEDHTADEPCHCCLYCDNFDNKYRTTCAKLEEDGTYSVCCADCSGIFPCECDCPCCGKNAEGTPENNGNAPVLTPDQQEEVISSFQAVMKKIVEFFNEFFNYIFEFLKFADIMGSETPETN